MDEAQQTLAIFLHLARASELRRRWLVRDKLLLMSALQAQSLRLDRLADHCRERLLAHNPGHLLGHFPSVEEAGTDGRIRLLVQQAERIFSREKAEHMLQTLGIELGRSEATYDSPDEYLQSILGPPPRIVGNHGRVAAVLLAPAPSAPLPSGPPAPSAEQVAERERLEFRALLAGLAGVSLCAVAWGAFLWTR